jgi:hypothetical protein
MSWQPSEGGATSASVPRKLIAVMAVAESILKEAALIDIKRRPADQIRGQSGCGPGGSSGQFRRGCADLILRLWAAAPSVATRLICTAAGEPGHEDRARRRVAAPLATELRATMPRAIGGPLAPVSQGP